MIPARFQDTEAARRLFGSQLDRLSPFLLQSDPLADAVVEAFAELPPGRGFHLLNAALIHGIDAVPDAPAPLRALFAAVDHVPLWVDWDAQDRGGAVFLRAGLLGGLVLGVQSLIRGYASPGGNKPLVFSGRLRDQAQRRLGETGRFVHAVSQAGGMRRFSEGFAITVKVRVMHAQVRRLLRQSGRFRVELWGEPINQHDMVATILLFSVAMIDGLEKLGYLLSPAEKEDVMKLWRYVGHVIGVDAELLPGSFSEAARLADMIRDTQGAPDDDSRALVDALLNYRIRAAKTERERRERVALAPISYGICRFILGDPLADQLGVPRTAVRHAVLLLRAFLTASGPSRRIPLLRDLALERGNRYWHQLVAFGLGEQPADFKPPERFAGAAS